MQPRYFIGIILPDNLSQTVTCIQRQFFIPGKVMEPLTPHITLLHPSILETLPPSFFIPKVKQVASKHLPINLTLQAIDMFDKRVLHIKLQSPELEELHRDLTALLPEKVRAQYEIGRKFTPHVTLAQAKPKQKLSPELIEQFKTKIAPLLPQTFTATHLTQFTWLRPRTYRVKPI